jgi:DNA mismatch repair protein MutS2
LSRTQRDFEATLAAIKASQAEIDEARERARVAEARAVESRRVAGEERRLARREREQAAATARDEAERAVDAIHAEIAEARSLLARQTLTESRLDEAMARLEDRLAAIPAAGPAPADGSAQGTWVVGQRAATRSGWQGTITAIDERGRATLAVGGAHSVVPVSELLPPEAVPQASRVATPARPSTGRRGELEPRVVRPAASRQVARPGRQTGEPRVVPATLDIRGARVDEALELLERTLDGAAMAGAGRLTIVHGHGSGALRDAVRAALSGHPLVREWRPGERGEGGDGATIVSL